MTLVLELPEELQRRVEAKAKERNTTPEAIAISAIDDSLPRGGVYITHLDTEGVPLPLPRTPAEAIEYWKEAGILGMWDDQIGDRSSVEFARELRRRGEDRHWEDTDADR